MSDDVLPKRCNAAGGRVKSLGHVDAGNRPVPHSDKKQPMPKQTSSTGWGGRREGAGRPLGSRNKPRLIHGLPETADPLQWLLNAMRHEALPLRLRMACAKALMPFMHPPG